MSTSKRDHKPVSNIKRLFNCLICADSRGRGLKETTTKRKILENLSAEEREKTGLEIEINVRPGAKLEDFARFLDSHPKKASIDFIIIIAGICNLTTRTINGSLKTLTYDKEDAVGNIKDYISQSIEQYGRKFHIATITPASLQKFNITHNSGAQLSKESLHRQNDQQESLTRDCNQLNDFIVEKNIERECPTLRWAGQCMRSTKRRDRRTKKLRPATYRFDCKKLTDGVHPDDALRGTWFSLINRFVAELIRREINPTTSYLSREPTQETETDSEESEREYEKYDFKRRKTAAASVHPVTFKVIL